ncbi:MULTISPECIES: hypothetical protein [Halobellus]|uniref:hypothetical protein n=1 Tax=Halobellus TaxID=1073986 RepID=UPI00211553FB|nr:MULTISPECIES: hypothetical protein [Halobellus]MDQ2055507.1 hypothetical protein [Halobellus sp. H-GB7]
MIENLSNIPMSVSFSLGGFSGSVFGWFLNEAFNQRRERRRWYSKISNLAHRANSISAACIDKQSVDYEDKQEFKELRKDFNSRLNPSISISDSVVEKANRINNNLQLLQSEIPINNLSEGEEYSIPKTTSYNEVEDILDETRTLALNLNNEAAGKAKSGIEILGVRI